jgi:hypothetical protein
MSSARPAEFRCGPTCNRVRHARVRRLANALAELETAAGRLLELPRPEGDDEDNDFSWQGVEDAAGVLWGVRVAAVSLRSNTLLCCHCDRDVLGTALRRRAAAGRLVNGKPSSRERD